MHTGHSIEQVRRDIIRLCYAGRDSRSLRVDALARLQRVTPYAAYCCLTTDPATLLFNSAVVRGLDPEGAAAFVTNELAQEDFNKITDLARNTRPATTLRLATKGDLVRSQRFREILEPQGFGNELRAVFRSGKTVWGALVMHREMRNQDFTSDDIAFFNAIAPHIAEGLRAALLLDAVEIAPTTDGPGLLLLAADLSVIATTPAAALLLDEVEDWAPGNSLPVPVHAVVARLRALQSGASQTADIIPRLRLRTRAGRWLTLHASWVAPQAAAGQIAVIIEQATPDAIAPFVLQAYALTAREQEVAALVLKGRSTEEISAQLCISVLTVQQHLKAVFDKVGVRSRRELVAQIFARSYWPALAGDHAAGSDSWSPA
ncbi:MAG TPA: LuxR C-terminal-related transcriptional regulator [Ktedonobacterales bacterium]|nr:LuxR C-terminal-related transcriptional regulator [Ktedonobacterales bacterium]